MSDRLRTDVRLCNFVRTGIVSSSRVQIASFMHNQPSMLRQCKQRVFSSHLEDVCL